MPLQIQFVMLFP